MKTSHISEAARRLTRTHERIVALKARRGDPGVKSIARRKAKRLVNLACAFARAYRAAGVTDVRTKYTQGWTQRHVDAIVRGHDF